MILCVESYIGTEGGIEGMKLEEQVAVTSGGYRVLSRFPYEKCCLLEPWPGRSFVLSRRGICRFN